MNNLESYYTWLSFHWLPAILEGTNVKQGLDKAAQLMGQDPDTASIILENIQINPNERSTAGRI